MVDCEEKAYQLLKEKEPNADATICRSVAREMCRLLDSGTLENDLERETVNIEYLVSRLEMREGDDNPSLKTKWNYWVGQKNSFFDGDYDRYQV
ncbi:hypothetical protein ACLI4U_12750 [Natrialbaceae archaeon A-CW2]